MNTALTLLTVLAIARGWHGLKKHFQRGRIVPIVTQPPRSHGERSKRSSAAGLPGRPTSGRLGKRPGRFSALIAAALLFGLQTVAVAPSVSAAACGEAPNPERPGAGMVGALDPPASHGENGSVYLDYSYAGMVWNTYQTNCGPLASIASPNSTIDTWAGN